MCAFDIGSFKVSLYTCAEIVEKPVPLKTSIEVNRQKKSCLIAAKVLSEIGKNIIAGVSTIGLNNRCEKLIHKFEGDSALKGYEGYPFSICTSVNNVAAHGLPGDYVLLDDDIVTIDLTIRKDGWHGDSAWTYMIGKGDAESRRLVKAAWLSTNAGIRQAKAGNRFGDVGHAIEKTAKRLGCSVIDTFVGHGIGTEMHEEPMVLNTGNPGTGLPIVPGMVFTIEPIVCIGEPEVFKLDDGWSVVTKDGCRCAQFEQTVAIFGDRTDILTLNGTAEIVDLDFPPSF